MYQRGLCMRCTNENEVYQWTFFQETWQCSALSTRRPVLWTVLVNAPAYCTLDVSPSSGAPLRAYAESRTRPMHSACAILCDSHPPNYTINKPVGTSLEKHRAVSHAWKDARVDRGCRHVVAHHNPSRCLATFSYNVKCSPISKQTRTKRGASPL